MPFARGKVKGLTCHIHPACVHPLSSHNISRHLLHITTNLLPQLRHSLASAKMSCVPGLVCEVRANNASVVLQGVPWRPVPSMRRGRTHVVRGGMLSVLCCAGDGPAPDVSAGGGAGAGRAGRAQQHDAPRLPRHQHQPGRGAVGRQRRAAGRPRPALAAPRAAAQAVRLLSVRVLPRGVAFTPRSTPRLVLYRYGSMVQGAACTVDAAYVRTQTQFVRAREGRDACR